MDKGIRAEKQGGKNTDATQQGVRTRACSGKGRCPDQVGGRRSHGSISGRLTLDRELSCGLHLHLRSISSMV